MVREMINVELAELIHTILIRANDQCKAERNFEKEFIEFYAARIKKVVNTEIDHTLKILEKINDYSEEAKILEKIN